MCDDCYHRKATKYRRCACGRQFKTSNNSTRCSSCSYAERRRQAPPCACGAEKDARAKRCRACERQYIAENGSRVAGRKRGPQKRGTKRLTSHGYVNVYIPEHPRSHVNGYVAEHTLVMEEVLGRYLLPGETAHHKNGNRSDNRPENLELWIRSQPAGQRAVDQVAWAREILALYGNLIDEHDPTSQATT